MNPRDLQELLQGVASGKVKVPAAIERLRSLPFEDLGFARVDHHRQMRRGVPEVVYGEGKTSAQCAAIVERIVKAGQPVLVTRASAEQFKAVRKKHPKAEWHEAARVIRIWVAGAGPGAAGSAAQSAGSVPSAPTPVQVPRSAGEAVGERGRHRVTRPQPRSWS